MAVLWNEIFLLKIITYFYGFRKDPIMARDGQNVTNRKLLPHQWRSDSNLKSSRRKVPGSILDLACRPSRSEFSVVFS